MRINGREYSKNWLSHQELQQGAIIDIDMTATPNKQRGTQPADFPYSFSADQK
jgi:putative alpha-1,2-mannosidase